MNSVAQQRILEFGQFRLDASGRILFRGGRPVPLPPKAADVLVLLVQNAGKLVEKEELLTQVWRNTFVEEGSLTRTISILRKALGEDESGQDYIATVSKRGYRFTAVVTQAAVEAISVSRERLMLAVLPFVNLSGEAAQEYFADGLTEEMITQLSRMNPERLAVIARTSAMKYKGTNKGIREIAAELAVAYVLEGSVRRADRRVRIAAQLIRASDETHLWAENYERDIEDILKLQSEVARAVAREIEVKLTPTEERRMAEVREVPPEAFEAYLRGRHLWNKRTEEGMRKSISLYEEAIHHYPEYASAYAGLADSHVMLACRGMAPAKKTFRDAKSAARRALELDNQLGEAHGSLAHVRLHDWDWEGLEKDFDRAIQLNPAQPIVYYWYGEFLMSRGRPEDAIAMTREAHRADPLSPVISSSLGMILYLARRYEESISVLERAQEVDPDHFLPHLRMGLVRIQQRQRDYAVSELRKAVDLAGQSTETLAALAMAHAAFGDDAAAQEIIDRLESLSRTRYVLPYNVAKIYAAGAKKEKAFEWLDNAYEEGNPDLIELNSEPLFDSLRRDQRFVELMRRVGWKV